MQKTGISNREIPNARTGKSPAARTPYVVPYMAALMGVHTCPLVVDCLPLYIGNSRFRNLLGENLGFLFGLPPIPKDVLSTPHGKGTPIGLV